MQSNDSEHNRLNNNSIDKLPKGANGKVFRTNQTSSYQQSRMSKTVKKDNQSFKDNAVLSTGQTPEIQIMTPLKDVKYVSKYSITKKVGTANQETRLKKTERAWIQSNQYIRHLNHRHECERAESRWWAKQEQHQPQQHE